MVVSDFIELHLKEWNRVYFIKVSDIICVSHGSDDNDTWVYLPHAHLQVDESYEDLKKLLESRTARALCIDEDDLK